MMFTQCFTEITYLVSAFKWNYRHMHLTAVVLCSFTVLTNMWGFYLLQL